MMGYPRQLAALLAQEGAFPASTLLGGTRHFTTFPPGLSSPGPPDHFESLLLEEHCAQFGCWVREKFLPIPFLVPKQSPLP